MFGLTKREQRWKAEEEAAKMLLGFLSTVIAAKASVEIARSNANALTEIEQLRLENAALKAKVNHE
jgi:hypothetical protein